MELADRYERVPYPGQPFAALHPARLAATARLFGLRTAPIERCRVLEIGCADGGHLLPMAAQLPQSSFLGVDLAAGPVTQASRVARQLGLTNVAFEARSFAALPDGPPFDYILCHGVYSWIEPPLRGELLELCRRRLAPYGVALISYNTLPGWYLRGLARGVMRLFPAAGGPAAEIARARQLMAWAAGNVHPLAPHAGVLRDEQQSVAAAGDAYLFHEHLAPRNDPVWFRDFVAAAGAAGLRWLGEARLADVAPERLGAASAEAVAAAADDLLVREQLMDVLQPRYFRRSLLCHAERRPSRRLDWRRLTRLRFAPSPLGGPAEDWVAASSPHAPLAAAVGQALAQRAPQSVSFAELLKAVSAALGGTVPMPLAELTGTLLLTAVSAGHLDVVTRRWPLAIRAGRRPTASPLARLQAAEGRAVVTSQCHEPVPIDEADRALLMRMDGRSTRADLGRVFGNAAAADARAALEERLDRFARAALLAP